MWTRTVYIYLLFYSIFVYNKAASHDYFINRILSKDNNYGYDMALDSQDRIHLSWDIDDVTQVIRFKLSAKIKRYQGVVFGFSDYGENENADVIVLWTDYDGKHYFQDAHTDDNGFLRVDGSQDYTLEDIKIYPYEVVLKFNRKYDTCDDNDYIIDPGTTHILSFIIPDVSEVIGDLNISTLNPVIQRTQLLKSQIPDPELPEDTETFVMNVDNVPIPDQETTYWCTVKKLPKMPKKRHIVKYEGAISDAGMGIVHHLEVFHCEVPPGVKVKEYDAPCKNMAERPKGLEECRKVIGAWAMGAKGISFPEETGLPIGGRGYSQYVMLEIHYNNPELHKGRIDSSGIRFYTTTKLRKYDAGIMELGMEYTDKYALPPQQYRWNLHGYCIPECTKVSLPEDGITVFGSQLHTHETGKTVYTKHYRNGVELPELNRDQHYSPHYQEIRKLRRFVKVLPGDSLVTTCEDTTADKKNITMGGFSISDEMCVNYIHYYPLTELEVCKSSVTTDSLYGYFNFMKEYAGENTSQKKGILDNYKSINWTPLNVHLLKTFYEMAPLSMQCNRSDGNRFPGQWENTHIPQVILPMPPEERPCLV